MPANRESIHLRSRLEDPRSWSTPRASALHERRNTRKAPRSWAEQIEATPGKGSLVWRDRERRELQYIH